MTEHRSGIEPETHVAAAAASSEGQADVIVEVMRKMMVQEDAATKTALVPRITKAEPVGECVSVCGLLELADTVFELRDLLLQDLGAALLAAVVVLALLRAVRFDALAADGLRRVAFLQDGTWWWWWWWVDDRERGGEREGEVSYKGWNGHERRSWLSPSSSS